MDIENPFYQEVVEALNMDGVEFILIGGLAVGYHGYSRYTGDMDLWINPSQENMKRLFKALLQLGYSKESVLEISESREVENPIPIKLWDDSEVFKVDLMTNTFQKEISWHECREMCDFVKINDLSIPVIHINHLIRMKKITKRLDNSLKNLSDAQELEKILRYKKK